MRWLSERARSDGVGGIIRREACCRSCHTHGVAHDSSIINLLSTRYKEATGLAARRRLKLEESHHIKLADRDERTPDVFSSHRNVALHR